MNNYQAKRKWNLNIYFYELYENYEQLIYENKLQTAKKFLRGIFKHINKWRVIIWSWTERINIVKHQFSPRWRTSTTGYEDLVES